MANNEKKELIITRVYDAPQQILFQVWVDPKHIMKN